VADQPTRHAWGTALLRVWLGVLFVMHGYLGLAVLGPETIAGYTTRMGFPASAGPALAWYLIAAHTVGGALLVIGLWTRVAALANLPIMAAAVFLLHMPQGFFMNGIIVDAAAGRAVAGGYEFTLTVLVATLAVMLLGAGALSLDHAIAERRTALTMEIP
jgi:putative oxidoreductase